MAQKNLYKEGSKKAKDKDITLAVLNDQIPNVSQKTNETIEYLNGMTREEVLAFLQSRKTDMDSSRPDELWDEFLAQYYSPFRVSKDGSTHTNLSIEQATIRNKIADIEAQPTLVNLIPTEQEDVARKDIIQHILRFVDKESNTEKEKSDFILTSLIFGTGVWFEGIFVQSQTLYEPEIQSDGKIIPKAKTITRSWLGGKSVDIRDVWIDPVESIEYAKDCYYQQKELSVDDIRGLLEDPNYNKLEVERFLAYLGKGDQLDHPNTNPFMTRQDTYTARKGKTILMHYYHKDKGLYIVTDKDFKYLLRYGALPYPHGELPFTTLVDHPKYKEIYGRGECELLRSTKYERNTVRDQIVDYAKTSNTINLAVGDNTAFEDAQMVSGVMQVWNFSGSLADSQFLKPPSQDSSLFNIDKLLQEDATWITGIDNNALVGSQSKTAFEARLQEQNKLKNIYVYLRNFDYAWERIMKQRLANIQFFMPLTTGKKILGDKKAQKYRILPIPDMELDGKSITVKGGKNPEVMEVAPKLKNMKGRVAFLELKPEYIRNSLDVTVETPTTTPILRELNAQQIDSFLMNLAQMSQIPTFAKIIEGIDAKKVVENKLESMGMNLDSLFSFESEEGQGDIMQQFMADVPKPYKANPDPQAQIPKDTPMSVLRRMEEQFSAEDTGPGPAPPLGQPELPETAGLTS